MEFVKHYMDEFFSQSVVIPKGENRHPCADVLHEWAENGGELTYRVGDSDLRYVIYDECTDFRIKPSEPMYEAVVRIHYADGTYEDTEKYFTYSEFEEFGFPKSCTWVESTKRERKQ